MDKRGQVTIFIIIGLVIVVGVVGFFLIRGNIFSTDSRFPEVTNAVEDCIEEVTMEGIYWNSLQGGYYDVPSPNIELEFLKVPILFNKGAIRVPSKETLESELVKYIQESLVLCFSDEEIKKLGYDVSIGEGEKIDVVISEESVNVEVEKSITISQEDASILLNKFSAKLDFDYLKKINLLQEFLDMQKENPQSVLLTQMENLAEEKGFNIEAISFEEEGVYLYNFLYEDKFKDMEYTYSFGVKY